MIAEQKLKLKLEKNEFAKEIVELLGLIVVANKISVNTQKIQAITDISIPFESDSLRSFLRLTEYYCLSIKWFADLSANIYSETSKNRTLVWSTKMQDAFDSSKLNLSSSLVLALPNLEVLIIVETDASSFAIGTILYQKQSNGKIHPIQYASRIMNAMEKLYYI